jgi:hypothetical protein
MSTCNAPRDGWENEEGLTILPSLLDAMLNEMLQVAPLFVQKIDCV